MTFSARPDRTYIRSTYRSNRFVLAEITAPAARRERVRPPVRLAFVIDRSGSMGGDKLRLAKLAVEESLARLHPTDEFSIVVYDEVIDVVSPSTPATAAARASALARLSEIEPRGSTNLGEGWLRGCEQVALALSADGVNRCLLLTDGLANVGTTDPSELAHHAGELRTRGVTTTTFGVGLDFDEALLQAMADAGGGHFYYIRDAAGIRDHVTSEVGETLEVVARDVTIELTAPDGVIVDALSPFPKDVRGARTTITVGDLVAEQRVQVVLRINFPFGEVGRLTGLLIGLADRDGVLGHHGEKLVWEYADNLTNDGQARDRDVDRAVARIFASRAQQEATARNRAGDFDGARDAIVRVSRRIGEYAGRDTDLRATVAELDRQAAVLAQPMEEISRKEMYLRSSNLARMRAPDGKAIRTDDRPGYGH